MIANHRVQPRLYRFPKGLRRLVRAKEPALGHCNAGLQRPQRAGDRIVLIAGNHHPPPAWNRALDGKIQRVRGVHGKNHLFRLRCVKQLLKLRPAGQRGIRRRHGGGVAAPSRRTERLQCPGHGAPHGIRLLKARGSAVQVNHTATS